MSENTYRAIGLVAFLTTPIFMIYGAGSHSAEWFFGSLAVGTVIVTICVALAERAALNKAGG